MLLFRAISSSTFVILDVQSIYTPSCIQDLSQEDNILSKRQTVFFTSLDPMIKEHRDPEVIDWKHRVLQSTIRKVEETSKHGVLGRFRACSKERI